MLNDIAKAIYDILIANATLMTALSGTAGNGYKTYHILARQNVSVPYVTFGIVSDTPIGTFTDPRAIDDTYWWINVFSDVSKTVGTLAGLVTAVLDNASLTVAGYTALKCVLDFIGSDIYDPDTGIFQVPLRYRIMVDKT